MSITSTVFNPSTGNKRTITMEVEFAYVQGNSSPVSDFYIKGTTSALDTGGNAILPFFLTSLSDLPDNNGNKQHPAGSTSAFVNATVQVENWTRRLIEGDATSTPVFLAMAI